MAEGTCDIGLIGLAVMGQNLVLNMNDEGAVCCAEAAAAGDVDGEGGRGCRSDD